MRYFLLDKITEVEVGKFVKGLKAITLSDPILHDHFPDHPVMPGALIIEGVAQLAGFLLEVTYNQTDENVKRALFVQVDKMKFYEISTPGELLEYQADLVSMIDDSARVNVQVHCKGQLRSRGTLTFHMASIDSENVKKQRIDLYRIWTKGVNPCPILR